MEVRGQGRETQYLDMHSQAARCVCVHRFIWLQSATFNVTKNKYSAQNELKQEEEQEDEVEEEEQEEEEGAFTSLLSDGQEGMLTGVSLFSC